MKRYWANKWAEYLEQPGLHQTKMVLSKGNTLKSPKCCLGHAEFMLGNKFVKNGKIWYLSDSNSYQGCSNSYQVLSHETQFKFGMRDCSGVLKTPVKYGAEVYYSLADLNDAGMPLKEIAKVIKSHQSEL